MRFLSKQSIVYVVSYRKVKGWCQFFLLSKRVVTLLRIHRHSIDHTADKLNILGTLHFGNHNGLQPFRMELYQRRYVGEWVSKEDTQGTYNHIQVIQFMTFKEILESGLTMYSSLSFTWSDSIDTHSLFCLAVFRCLYTPYSLVPFSQQKPLTSSASIVKCRAVPFLFAETLSSKSYTTQSAFMDMDLWILRSSLPGTIETVKIMYAVGSVSYHRKGPFLIEILDGVLCWVLALNRQSR